MKEFLFAPMEGVTLAGYRAIHHRMFPGAVEYYTPFIAPDSNGSFRPKYLRELTADCGTLTVVPQLLVNRADAFCATAEKLCELGFREINLNAGCPSGTVFSKHKGAGMLLDLASLDAVLDGIYSHAGRIGYRVSIKTRMGVRSTEEFPAILEVYRKYPVSRLIVHARCREDYYRGEPDRTGFAAAVRGCPFPVVYNGDVRSAEDLAWLGSAAPQVDSVMIGRAAVANPALFRYLQTGEQLRLEELTAFHDELTETWLASGLSPVFTVERMKTLWTFMQELFPEAKREVKAVLKAKTMPDYRIAVGALFRSGSFRP
ncbi:MAG: tRNA-dihydrouridine synthase family protein [Oscillospiraceae bacterium]|nr:tRNA-dihydrouridine synthase family protein [Oscillospiraceae bacterium]